MPLFRPSGLPETFPEVRAVTLDGDARTLPADLPAPLTLVVVLFKDDLDPLADQWARLGHSIEELYPGQFAVIETPVVGRGMKLLGDLATSGIRGQVDGEQEHARTFPIYVDKKPFRKALKLGSEGDVHAFLVQRADGAILWAGEGAIDLGEVQALEAAVTEAAGRVDASGERLLEAEDDAAEAEFDGPGEIDGGVDPPGAPGETP